MTTDIKKYQDLLGFLLGPLRQRPALYLGEPKITRLPNFIVGFDVCLSMTQDEGKSRDRYFHPGFIKWYHDKKNLPLTSSWTDPFLKEALGDDKKALEIYFKYLDEYSTTITTQSMPAST